VVINIIHYHLFNGYAYKQRHRISSLYTLGDGEVPKRRAKPLTISTISPASLLVNCNSFLHTYTQVSIRELQNAGYSLSAAVQFIHTIVPMMPFSDQLTLYPCGKSSPSTSLSQTTRLDLCVLCATGTRRASALNDLFNSTTQIISHRTPF
jgi:hypothetical protein